jgi:hypothetical protein
VPTASDAEATPVVIATPGLGDASIDFGGDLTDPGLLINSVNPFALLQNFDGASGFSSDIDPSLKNDLLAAGDLPQGFLSMGEFSFAMPSEYGEMQMAANIFTSADAMSTGELGTMVMSAAIIVPPEAMAEFDAGGLDELQNLSDEDLAAAMGGVEGFGGLFTELSVLDGSGLGEGGAGIHMVMDMSSLGTMFGAPAAAETPASIGIDMYMFIEGGRMHMAIVMYPGDASPGVDARQLANVLDSRSGATA